MLERFRKTGTQDPDPNLRADALEELPVDDPVFLTALSGDEDAGVRVRLVQRVTDLALVDERRLNDAAPAVVEAARARLRALLGEGDDATETARLAFLDGNDDADVLNYAALNGASATIREKAFRQHARFEETHDLLRVAMAAREKDTSLQALASEGLDDEALLERIAAATRKSDKVSYRFVKDRLKSLRDATQAATDMQKLVEELKGLAAEPVAATSEALHHAVAVSQQWQERWSGLAAMLGKAAPSVKKEQGRLHDNIEQARAIIKQRADLLEQVTAATAESMLDVAQLREQWAALPDTVEREDKAFADAIKTYEQAEKALRSQQTAVERAAGLLERFNPEKNTRADAAALEKAWAGLNLAADDEQAAALVEPYNVLLQTLRERDKKQAAAVERAVAQANKLIEQLETSLEAGQITPATSACDKLTHRLKAKKDLPAAVAASLDKRLAVLAPKLRDMKQARVWSTQQAREQLIVEIEGMAAEADDVEPKVLADKVKALRTKWRELDHGVGPAHEDIWKRFDGACEKAYAPAKAHFDAEASQRRDNAAAKRAICEKLEAYEKAADWETPQWEEAGKLINESRKAWRDAGAVNHRQFQKLRKRFDAALKPIESQLEAESEREVQRRALAMKALETCIAGEPLDRQIDLAKRIQREWRPTVRARRRKETEMWDALRKMCDGVFSQRDEKFAQRKTTETAAMAERRDICAAIEALVPAPDAALDEAAVKALTASYSELKERWRSAGDVHPKQRNAIAGRYRDVCKKMDGLRDDLKRRGRTLQVLAVIQRLGLVDQRWRALAAGEANAVTDDAWQAVAIVKGAVGKKLDAAFAAEPPGKNAGETRAQLCLRAELAGDVESPAALSGERMALKIELLRNAMSGEAAQTGAQAVNEFVEQWMGAAVDGSAEDDALAKRFIVALDALAHRR